MTAPLIPNLNDSEQLIGAEALQAFIDAPWRIWTHCSGMKRPYIWQRGSRRAYRKLVKMNQDIMMDMLCRGDVEDCFVFGRNIGLVHRLKHRPDFGTIVVQQWPMPRRLFLGNDCLRGGVIFQGGVCDPAFGV